MLDKKRKGEPSPLLIGLGLLIGVVILGTMAYPIQNFFAGELDTSIEDLDRVADSKAYGQLYFYNYVPTAGVYSTYQNSYELARQGGSPSLDWNSDMYSSSSSNIPYGYYPGTSCSTIQDTISRIGCRLGENVTDDMQSLVTASDSGRCERPDYNLDVWFNQGSHSIEGNIFAIDPIQVTCSFSDGEAMYRANNSFLSLDFDVTGNRYLHMAEEANRTLNTLYREWDEINYYTAKSNAVCSVGNTEYSNAESDALSSANTDVTNGFQSAISGGPNLNQMIFEEAFIKGPSDTLDYGATSNNFTVGQTNTELTDVNNNCCGHSNDPDGDNDYNDGPCNDWEDKAKVNITVEESNVKLVVKDQFSKVPVNSGKRYMEFIVNPYTHDFTSD